MSNIPGIGNSSFKLQLNKDWLTNSDFIKQPINYKVGEWSIFSVVKSRAIMIQLSENSCILDPGEQLLKELYKHIK